MDQAGVQTVAEIAEKKIRFFSRKIQYLLYSMLAGSFCSIGMAFAYSAGSGVYLSPAVSGLYKLAIGICFALSFTLIIFSGSELFTGNVMTMTVGALSRTCRTGPAAALLCYCYFANLLGAACMGAIIASTGILDGPVGELLSDSCAVKMSLPFGQAFSRGIMCNILVCLGTWMAYRMKSETAKMIAILWVVAGFVTPGYEHSIANAGLFTMTALSPIQNPDISLAGAISNIVPVTIGNVVGGVLFVGFVYWFAGSSHKKERRL